MGKIFYIIGIPLVGIVLLWSLGIVTIDVSPKATIAQGPPTPPPAQGGPSGWTDDGTIVRLTTDTDRVGIGTANPLGKLDVIGNINVTGDIAISGLVDGFDIGVKAPDWDAAFAERRQWNGGATNLDSSLGRSSLGLGSLATLSSVSGGTGGTIQDKTVVTDDLGVLNHAIFKDTDGVNCHKITFNSAGALSAVAVDCSTGGPIVMGAFDNFDTYFSGNLTGKNGGSGWFEPWQTQSGFASMQIQTSSCQSGNCVKGSGATETFDSRAITSPVTNGRIDFFTKVIEGGGASHVVIVGINSSTPAFNLQTRSSAPGNVIRLVGATTENLGNYTENVWQHVEAEFGDTGGSGVCAANQVRARLDGGSWSSCIGYLNNGDIGNIKLNYANNTNAEYWIDELKIFKD